MDLCHENNIDLSRKLHEVDMIWVHASRFKLLFLSVLVLRKARELIQSQKWQHFRTKFVFWDTQYWTLLVFQTTSHTEGKYFGGFFLSLHHRISLLKLSALRKNTSQIGHRKHLKKLSILLTKITSLLYRRSYTVLSYIPIRLQTNSRTKSPSLMSIM